MKTANKLFLATLVAVATTAANAQFVTDGAFGPIAQATPRTAVEKQIASPTERAMNKADTQTVATKKETVTAVKAPVESRRDAFGQVDTAR
jgi:hypothetical protein